MSTTLTRFSSFRTALAAASALALLTGCVSIGAGGDAPDQLLTLTSAATVEAGSAAQGNAADALAVQVPSVTQRLNVNRVPVRTGDASLAYLQDAFWVEKPASLFQQVLAETIRAKGSRFVVDGGGLEYAAATQLAGDLVDMGYDATNGSVVVRYDAVLKQPDGSLRTQRFEHVISGVRAEAADVGRALNLAANVVAGEVADWVE